MQESRRADRLISFSLVTDVQAGGIHRNLCAGNVRKREGKIVCRMSKMHTGNAHG